MTPEPESLGDALPPALVQRLAAHVRADAPPPTFDRKETPEERAERDRLRRETYAARNAARWTAAVPPLYATASPSDLDASQRFTWPPDSLTLVLAGNVGTGKTHAAYAIGNDHNAAGVWVHGVTVVDLLAALRPDGDALVADAVRRCGLLILDDLSASTVSEWAQEQMTNLMDLRIREGLRTIVTTNVVEADLEAAWGGRLMDRLRFRRTVVVYRGASRRREAF